MLRKGGDSQFAPGCQDLFKIHPSSGSGRKAGWRPWAIGGNASGYSTSRNVMKRLLVLLFLLLLFFLHHHDHPLLAVELLGAFVAVSGAAPFQLVALEQVNAGVVGGKDILALAVIDRGRLLFGIEREAALS